MLFTKPIPFKEALAYRKAQKILPTSAGSAELAQLGVQIRERALFSARTTNAGYLAKMDKLLTKMTSPATTRRTGDMHVDPATFRLKMRAHLAQLSYAPEKPGSLQDLGSDARLNLIAKMQMDQAYGYGQHIQAQDPDLLDLWPAQELVRVESRKVERQWIVKWQGEGGKLYGGRMIARKDDPIWAKLSRFGTPYPPFDFNSGMGLRDVRRDEAEELGVLKRSDIVQPDDRSFNKTVESTFPKGISKGLAVALQKLFTIVGDKILLEAAQ